MEIFSFPVFSQKIISAISDQSNFFQIGQTIENSIHIFYYVFWLRLAKCETQYFNLNGDSLNASYMRGFANQPRGFPVRLNYWLCLC